MNEIAFEHRLSAHCESGVTSSLLRHRGQQISEPLAFGIGSGLFFAHIPFDKRLGPMATSFRSFPGTLFTKACERLGVGYAVHRYRDPAKADAALEGLVQHGVPVGLQTSVYWLSYLPKRFRFPFNAHNIVVYGRGEAGWKVSDPVLDLAVDCPDDALRRARFAPGVLAPRGRLYHLTGSEEIPRERLRRAILAGARETARRMSRIPLPWFGWKAIRLLAKRMERWPGESSDPREALLRLASIVRVQEEVGTGGAGFRYLYAAFLQEAGEVLEDPTWGERSGELTAIGDRWREFAARAARIYKSGQADEGEFREAAAIVRECALRERAFFDALFRQLR